MKSLFKVNLMDYDKKKEYYSWPQFSLSGCLKRGKVGNLNLTLSGPGGLRGPDGQTHSCQSETSYPMMPKLSDF